MEPQVINADEITESKADIVLSMESMIKANIDSLENSKEEKKKLKDLLEGIYENDSTYRQHKEQAKEAAKILRATKAQLDKQPQAAELKEKIKGVTGEIKEVQLSLFDYVSEYKRMSGCSEIEASNGEIYEIRSEAKLVKRSKFEP